MENKFVPAPFHGLTGGGGGGGMSIGPFITGGGSSPVASSVIALGAFAAAEVKPYYDKCMGGEPTFLPKKVGTGKAPG